MNHRGGPIAKKWSDVGASVGGVSDGDKGDVTVSGSGATWTIDNDAVTYAKIQNVSASRLLGRRSGSSGDVEEVQIGAGLSISAGAQLAASVTGISINSVASADVDLLNATPAASAGRQNVTWATSGVGPTSVSASVFQGATLFKNLSADDTGGVDGLTAQPWFPTSGAVTVTANRAYRVHGLLRVNKPVTNATNLQLLFGGTCTISGVKYRVIGQSQSADNATGTAQNSGWVVSSTAVIVVANNSVAYVWAEIVGTIRITTGGTLIPQFKFSNTPGSGADTVTVRAGTFFELTEIGADTVTERGTWA